MHLIYGRKSEEIKVNMKNQSRFIAACCSILFMLLSPVVLGGGLDDLERFYSNIKTYTAAFEQEVMDEYLNLLEASGGKFTIKRPGKFYWHYTSPSEQMIIGDGRQVWIYDVELEQATQRNADMAVTQTPASLLSGVGELDDHFTLQELGEMEDLNWVRMLPKQSDSGFIDVQIGFSDGRLQQLILRDSFGQTTRMQFTNIQEDIDIDEQIFSFNPPQGVDVIREGG
jgi:chaperone LolA